MKGIINSRPIYNFNELQGKLTHTQVDSINASTITTGILATQHGGTGTSQKNKKPLCNLGISTSDTMIIRVAADGTADFITITAAIQSLPKLLDHTVYIYVAPGTYTEDITFLGFYGPGMIYLTTEYEDLVTADTLGPVIIEGAISVNACTAYINIGCNLAPTAEYPNPYFKILYNSSETPSATKALLSALNSSRIYCKYIWFKGNPVANYAATSDTSLPRVHGVQGTHNSYIYITGCLFQSLYNATYSTYGAHIVLNNSVGGQGTSTAAVSSTNNQNKYAGYATYGGKITFIKGPIPGSNIGTRPYAHTSNGGIIIGTTNGTVTTKFA